MERVPAKLPVWYFLPVSTCSCNFIWIWNSVCSALTREVRLCLAKWLLPWLMFMKKPLWDTFVKSTAEIQGTGPWLQPGGMRSEHKKPSRRHRDRLRNPPVRFRPRQGMQVESCSIFPAAAKSRDVRVSQLIANRDYGLCLFNQYQHVWGGWKGTNKDTTG